MHTVSIISLHLTTVTDMETKTQKLIERWQYEIAVIQKDIEDLLYSRRQIADFEALIQQSDFAKNNIGLFWEHYKMNYLFFAVSKVFHQIDQDPRSISLINLLKSLVCNTKAINGNQWQKGTSIFDQQVIENFGKNILVDHSIVIADINKLEKDTMDVKLLRNKRIAHIDRGDKVIAEISAEKLNSAIDSLEVLTRRYLLLLTSCDYSSLIAKSDSWKTAFTQSWVSK